MSAEGEKLRKAFWEEDRIKHGGEMFRAYTEIMDTNANRNAQTEQLIEDKLSRLLEHAVNTTEFYAEKVARGG